MYSPGFWGLIDARAVVDAKADMDEGVEIGPFSVIGPEVKISRGTWIGPHAVINGPTVIGRDNRIFQFASLGEDPQDMKSAGEKTRLEIGDRNVFRDCPSIPDGRGQTRKTTGY